MAIEESIEQFRIWSALNPAAPLPAILEELRFSQVRSSLRVADRVLIFLGTVFTEALLTEHQIQARKPTLALLGPNPIQQRHIIAGFEWICGARFPSLLKFFPLVLKQLFDEDIVEEEVFLAWAVDLSRNEHSADASLISIETLEVLRTTAAPFIKWLQEAEEEGEEEEA